MVTIYKQFDKETLDSSQHRAVSSQDKLTINTTINNFVQYFAIKHSS